MVCRFCVTEWVPKKNATTIVNYDIHNLDDDNDTDYNSFISGKQLGHHTAEIFRLSGHPADRQR